MHSTNIYTALARFWEGAGGAQFLQLLLKGMQSVPVLRFFPLAGGFLFDLSFFSEVLRAFKKGLDLPLAGSIFPPLLQLFKVSLSWSHAAAAVNLM